MFMGAGISQDPSLLLYHTAHPISPSLALNPGLPPAREITTPNHRPRKRLRASETISHEGFLEKYVKNSQENSELDRQRAEGKKRGRAAKRQQERESTYAREASKRIQSDCVYTARSVDVVKSYNPEEQRSVSSSPCTSSNPTALSGETLLLPVSLYKPSQAALVTVLTRFPRSWKDCKYLKL